mmetsp:Transcript_1592/g.4159  ORF Transcript_1592/g.4159 Transcript_1592/m.4159 type:complete len:162 (+) Transcript_1592:1951-2436(+)
MFFLLCELQHDVRTWSSLLYRLIATLSHCSSVDSISTCELYRFGIIAVFQAKSSQRIVLFHQRHINAFQLPRIHRADFIVDAADIELTPVLVALRDPDSQKQRRANLFSFQSPVLRCPVGSSPSQRRTALHRTSLPNPLQRNASQRITTRNPQSKLKRVVA